jgi:formylglycine-generating enzyme required for sulfatase activity
VDAAPPDLVNTRPGKGGFTATYLALHPFVRRPGPESDYNLLTPTDYHASTSELIQMLEKGHYDVALGEEDWDRIVTWIDLNVPDFGTWREALGDERISKGHRLRQAARAAFAGIDTDPESTPKSAPARPRSAARPAHAVSRAKSAPAATPSSPSTPAAALKKSMIEPVPGLRMEFVELAAGRFVMGSVHGANDEAPVTEVVIERPFRIGRVEVSNRAFAAFDAEHDSRYIDQQHKDHTKPGYPANRPDQPVVRVTWEEARAFCAWLSERTGQRCDLPTEAQWEYACRAGAVTPFSFGALDADFAPHANLADRQIGSFAVHGVNPQPMENPSILDDFIPRDARFNDGHMISAKVGSYRPNSWGVQDMHGNVAEWTRSLYRPYPYRDNDGRNDVQTQGRRVVRGGSWRDRPHRATTSYRLAYNQWQPVFNVGFRVVVED